jgi:hypothetical protein
MNWKRILVGGLAAGLLMIAIDALVGATVLMPRYQARQADGTFLKNPQLPFAPLWILGFFAIGLILAWLYAATRPRLGPGPGTALIVGLAVGLLAHVPYPFALACWSPAGRLIPLVWMLSGLAEYVLATLLAGYLYREEAPTG